MEKRDILIISQYFYPEFVTAANLVFDTAKALSDAGYSVDVLCGYPSEYKSDEKTKYPIHEQIYGINITRLRYFSTKRVKAIGRIINNLSFCSGLFLKLFSMRKYRMVLTYSSPPILSVVATASSRLFKNKVAFVSYDLYPEIAIRTGHSKENGLMSKVMRIINKNLAKRTDLLVCISSEMKDYYVNERKVDQNIIRVIPNWHEDIFREYKNFNTETFTVGYLGNMGVCQDMDTILDTIDSLGECPDGKDIYFVFAGHGNKKTYVEERTKNNNNVDTYGFLQGDKYSEIMERCDCFVVSLEKGLGGLCAPSKTYSYLMMGKPIIAVLDEKDIICDIEKYKMGVCVKNGDVEALKTTIIKMHNSPDTCRLMGENARKCFLDNYTYEKRTLEYIDAVREILG